jgi:hypothetical protein
MKKVGLLWKHPFSPYSRISQVPIEIVRAKLLEIFARWGKAGSFRVDNGEPLGSACINPTPPLALWLIAHDIDMIWNKPYCPQMNGKVEKMQDTTQRWAEIDKCQNLADLQEKLNQQIKIQRETYPVVRFKNKTRLEEFPELETSRRIFKQQDFNPQRVYDFFAKKIYTRKVSAGGQITHFGQKITLGSTYKEQYVQLQLNKDKLQWIITANHKAIKNEPANNLSPERILNITVFSKNETNIKT